jgi:hypothetical protein
MRQVRLFLDSQGYQEWPFVVGVVAALTAAESPTPRWRWLDRDTFDDLLAELAPTLTLPQGTLTFRTLDDFEPAALSAQLSGQGGDDDPTPLGANALLDALRSSAPPRPAPANPLDAFIDRALEGTTIHRGDEPASRLPGAARVRAVLREPAFRALEATWRGLYHLVRHTDTDASLRLRVCDARRDDLATALQSLPAAEPLNLLLADFAFGRTDEEVTHLYPLAKTLAQRGTLLLAGERADPEADPEADAEPGKAWPVFRRLEAARQVALVGPRVLARYPHASDEFTEITEPTDRTQYLWANAIWRVGAAVLASVAETGWFARLHNLRLEGLPTPSYRDADGESVLFAPVETPLDDKAMLRRADEGWISVVHERGSDRALVPVLRTLQEPTPQSDAEATAAVEVMARVPYVLASQRFVQAARLIGADTNRLNEWLSDYVSAYGPLLDAAAERQGGTVRLFLQPWLGPEELPGAVFAGEVEA